MKSKSTGFNSKTNSLIAAAAAILLVALVPNWNSNDTINKGGSQKLSEIEIIQNGKVVTVRSKSSKPIHFALVQMNGKQLQVLWQGFQNEKTIDKKPNSSPVCALTSQTQEELQHSLELAQRYPQDLSLEHCSR